MPYDAASRILSFSFERDPAEHADVTLSFAKRLKAAKAPISGGSFLAGAVALGLAVGLCLELYRRFVLTAVLDTEAVPPLGIILLQLLPFVLLLAVVAFAMSRWAIRRQRQALRDRLDARVFIDMDIYSDGIRFFSDKLHIQVDWIAVRDVRVSDRRIEFELDSLILYLPLRAFENPADMSGKAAELQSIWTKARDSKQVVDVRGKNRA